MRRPGSAFGRLPPPRISRSAIGWPKSPSRSTIASRARGSASMLLERLAVIAARHGFERFQASTLTDNTPMLEVFRDSGFEIRSKSSGGAVDLQLSLTPSAKGVHAAEERDRAATAASLRPMLAPAAVAVIGASRDPSSIGRRVLDALRAAGFKGRDLSGQCERRRSRRPRLLSVGPRAAARNGSRGHRGAEPRRPRRRRRLRRCRREVAGGDHRRLRRDRRRRARAAAAARRTVRNYGMRMVGPNCMGLLNASPEVSLNASFSPVMPPPGSVGFSSQSGALGLAILELARQRGVGLSTFVSVGNKADVSGNDLLQYLGERPGHARDPAVSRIVREPAPLRPARAAHRADQADRRRESGPHAGRLAGRGQPHGGARRQRRRRQRPLPAVRRHPRRHHRRDVRHRRLPGGAAAARRPPRRDRHQRGRPRHPRRRCLRGGRAPRHGVFRRDARPPARVPPAGSDGHQSGRHGRVGGTGCLSPDDRDRARIAPTSTP